MIFSFFLLRAIQAPCAVGLALCIVGAATTANDDKIFQQTILRVGIILFVVVFIMLVLLFLIAAIARSKTGRGERQLVMAVGISLPFLTVRVVYSLVECFGSYEPGSVLASQTGHEFLIVFLAYVEEMAVTLVYIIVGIVMPTVPKEGDSEEARKPLSRLGYRAQRGDFNGGKLGYISLLFELVSSVFRMGQNRRASKGMSNEGVVEHGLK